MLTVKFATAEVLHFTKEKIVVLDNQTIVNPLSMTCIYISHFNTQLHHVFISLFNDF